MLQLLKVFRRGRPSYIAADAPVSPIRIPTPSCSTVRKYKRVSATILNQPVFFETRDVDLTPSSEAFGTAFLIASALQHCPLEFTSPVARDWLLRAQATCRIANEWWASARNPLLNCQTVTRTSARRETTGLFFSCGIDSFYTLLTQTLKLDYLIGVLGFDIRLDDRNRQQDFTQQLQRICHQLNLKPLIVRTNLRRHSFFRQSPWEKTHGSALASVGHLLESSIGTAIISSNGTPNATLHFGTDHGIAQSFGSDSLEIQLCGADQTRFEKICHIAPQPIVQEHLRVCWEHRNSNKNCGRCEKCLRTMITLEAIGYLEKFESFGFKHRIAESLDRLPNIPPCQYSHYQQVLHAHPVAPIQAAIQRLLNRSHS